MLYNDRYNDNDKDLQCVGSFQNLMVVSRDEFELEFSGSSEPEQ